MVNSYEDFFKSDADLGKNKMKRIVTEGESPEVPKTSAVLQMIDGIRWLIRNRKEKQNEKDNVKSTKSTSDVNRNSNSIILAVPDYWSIYGGTSNDGNHNISSDIIRIP